MTQRLIIDSIEPKAWHVRLRDEETDQVHDLELRGSGPWQLSINGSPTVGVVPPPDTTITLRLDNSDGSGTVRVGAVGSGAIAWTQTQGTLLGAKWIRDAKGAPIALLEDAPELTQDIARVLPHVTLDLSRYTPPAGRTNRAPAPRRLSSETGVTLVLDNMGGSGIVQITVTGPNAAVWTAAKGTLLGIKWSGGVDGVPKIILEDRPELVREVEHEAPDVALDTSAYEHSVGEAEDPPAVEPAFPRLPPRARPKRSGGGRGAPKRPPEDAEEVPVDEEITLVLDNMDRTDGLVLITAKGPRAAVWAEQQGSLLGSRWEIADGELPYVYVSDATDLVEQIGREHKGIRLDTSEFWKHSAEELAEIEASLARAGEARPAEARPAKASDPDELRWVGISEAGVVGLSARGPGGVFKILRAGGRTFGLFFEYDAGGYRKIACGSLEELKAQARALFAEEPRPVDEELARQVCPDVEPAASEAPSVPPGEVEPPPAPTDPPPPSNRSARKRVTLKAAGLRPLNAASKAILDLLTRDLADPSSDGESAHTFDNAPGAFLPAHVERIDSDRYSVAHYIEQNGDRIADPDIEFILEAGEWYPAAVTQVPVQVLGRQGGGYRVAIDYDEEGQLRVSKKAYNDLREFAQVLLTNIKEQQGLGRAPRRPAAKAKEGDEDPSAAKASDPTPPAAEPPPPAVNPEHPSLPVNPELDEKLVQSFARALQNVKIDQ